MNAWNEALERTIEIRARRETVFRYFTDSERFARWWGAGSRIDPMPGGEVFIRYPNAVEARGKVVEIEPPERIAFTYQYADGTPADGSLVTIALEETKDGTVLRLSHAFSSAKLRDAHVQGWRYQLAVFSKVISEEGQSGAAGRVDAWLRAWGDPDPAARRAALESCATPDVSFRDAYSLTNGLSDLLAHLEAVQIFLPGIRLARDGDVRVSHGTAVARWTATGPNGAAVGRGLNVFELAPDGRIAGVVGFWEGP
jgi:uncharacterized protein YndB with AHSA1/START domain